MTDWRKLVGHRVLVKERGYLASDSIIEVVVVEVSPSGEYVKLRVGDRTVWVSTDRYEVVEDLGIAGPSSLSPLPELRKILWGE